MKHLQTLCLVAGFLVYALSFSGCGKPRLNTPPFPQTGNPAAPPVSGVETPPVIPPNPTPVLVPSKAGGGIASGGRVSAGGSILIHSSVGEAVGGSVVQSGGRVRVVSGVHGTVDK